MNNKFTVNATLTLEHKNSSSHFLMRTGRQIGTISQVYLDGLDTLLTYLKAMTQYFLLIIFVLWLAFLSVGLLISIFGANLEQQRYSSERNIATNDFIHLACQTKSACKTYRKAKLDCLLDTNATGCLARKMHGTDYTECRDDDGMRDINEKIMPDVAQCIGSKFASLIK